MMQGKRAVSNMVFGAIVIILLIIAVAGFGLYATSSTKTVTSTATSVGTTTVTASVNSSTPGVSGGFLGSKVVAFSYPTPYECSPSTSVLFPSATAAGAKTPCEAGANGTLPANAIPVWGAVPAFAGLSIFGVTALGASPQGFAVYHNQTIITDCGAGGTVNACPQHPEYLYSPAFTAVEQHLNITTGYGGLPEGVLPTPDHDHIIDSSAGGANIPWDVITVLVFDPNIMPNPVTGTCSQVVPSSLANATGNCLTSLAALKAALVTNNSDIAAANVANPIYQTLGSPTTQVIIPGDSAVSEINNDNGNLNVYFAVGNSSPYPPTQSIAGGAAVIATVSLIGLIVLRRAELANLIMGRAERRSTSTSKMQR
jgi:hypothetical protein